MLGLPALMAFAFGAWVLYSILIDVSERDMEIGGIGTCVEGCQRPPSQFVPWAGKGSLPLVTEILDRAWMLGIP